MSNGSKEMLKINGDGPSPCPLPDLKKKEGPIPPSQIIPPLLPVRIVLIMLMKIGPKLKKDKTVRI